MKGTGAPFRIKVNFGASIVITKNEYSLWFGPSHSVVMVIHQKQKLMKVIFIKMGKIKVTHGFINLTKNAINFLVIMHQTKSKYNSSTMLKNYENAITICIFAVSKVAVIF